MDKSVLKVQYDANDMVCTYENIELQLRCLEEAIRKECETRASQTTAMENIDTVMCILAVDSTERKLSNSIDMAH